MNTTWLFPFAALTQDQFTISWRDPEILLIIAGGVLTLILLGVFIYVFTRKQE